MTSAVAPRSRSLSLGPWLWGAQVDLAVFGGTALLAFVLVALGRVFGWHQAAESPAWVWLALVLLVDVAHVYSTIFRTYLDGEELQARPVRYIAVPIACYAVGIGLHFVSSGLFWTVVAYAAVFHFIRQQVGWVAVYRARAGQLGRLDRWVDDAAVYAATGYPIVYWHGNLDRARFVWMKDGDFIDVAGSAARVEPFVLWFFVAALGLFLGRQVLLAWRGTLHLGKLVVVVTTAAVWYVGIVATNSDFDFTVTNVIVHGVPYLALLWAYARERRKDAPGTVGSRVAVGGLASFLAVLVALAFAEELAWDHLVWHDRPWLFGESSLALGGLALTLIVPVLTVPQLTHYVLDGFIWRRADSRRLRAQRAAIGL